MFIIENYYTPELISQADIGAVRVSVRCLHNVTQLLPGDKSLETKIYDGLYYAFLDALRDIYDEYLDKDKTICRNIAVLVEKLEDAPLTNFEDSNQNEVLSDLKKIIRNESRRFQDEFPSQQIDKLKSILKAHQLNLHALKNKNYHEFTRHQSLVPGEDLIQEPVLLFPVQSQGFFDKYPKAAYAGSLLVASLPTIAYFCIEAFKDFLSDLPLPAPLCLAIAGVVLGGLAYQLLKSKESAELRV